MLVGIHNFAMNCYQFLLFEKHLLENTLFQRDIVIKNGSHFSSDINSCIKQNCKSISFCAILTLDLLNLIAFR